jgi:hypothetical protein
VGVTDNNDGRSVALVDLWNRGVLTWWCANQRGPALVLKNTAVVDNKWISFELEGTASNRAQLELKSRCFLDGKQQVQTLTGAADSVRRTKERLHFGLGKKSARREGRDTWPSETDTNNN